MSVSQWREAHGVARDADFAFFFLEYVEALEEGGLEVAQAWAACHASIGAGEAGAVRAVVASHKVPGPRSLRALGLPPPRVAAVPAKRPLSSATPLVEKNQEFGAVLEEIFMTGSPYHAELGRYEASKSTVPPLVHKLLSLKRVALTWSELKDWAVAQGRKGFFSTPWASWTHRDADKNCMLCLIWAWLSSFV